MGCLQSKQKRRLLINNVEIIDDGFSIFFETLDQEKQYYCDDPGRKLGNPGRGKLRVVDDYFADEEPDPMDVDKLMTGEVQAPGPHRSSHYPDKQKRMKKYLRRRNWELRREAELYSRKVHNREPSRTGSRCLRRGKSKKSFRGRNGRIKRKSKLDSFDPCHIMYGMNPPKSNCPHITIVGQYTKEDIINKQQSVCDFCEHPGPNLWVCLHRECLYVGCGENAQNHSVRHFQKHREHCLLLNLTSYNVYCFLCECEVFLENNDPPLPGMLLTQPTTVARSESDSDDEIESPDACMKPKGLTGLQNMGNTCYMNSALQSLSNCPQLTNFFLECQAFVKSDKKPGLARSYMMLIREMWHKKRPSYVVPSGIAFGIKLVFPVFRGYTQQDAQEFLRCFMDQLHEELKEPVIELCNTSSMTPVSSEEFSGVLGLASIPVSEESSQSDCDYETCDSGPISEKDSCPDEAIDQSEPSQESSDIVISVSPSKQNKQGYPSFGDSAFSETYSSLDAGESSINTCQRKKHSIIMDVSYMSPLSNSSSDTVKANTMYYDRGDGSAPKEEYQSSLEASTGLFDESSCDSRNDSGCITASIVSSHVQKGQGAQQASQMKNYASQAIIDSMLYQMKKPVQYRSIISDVFDGKILSCVQCLICNTVSFTKETFQDLSLPIPTRDHLHMIHASHQKAGGTCTDVYSHRGLFSSFVNWMLSWFTGPSISVQDCLAAFFSADELKGDNMYSCEKCKKLRNGVKYSKVVELPEVLCIHLKRFRHEVMYSSKISSHVSFPLEGLDMSPFFHKPYPEAISTYDLASVICHHGTAGSGHYTAYSLNYLNDQWYEFDDQYVTAVDAEMVQNCEAYVLFYRKSGEEMIRKRVCAVELLERSKNENGLLKFFISKQWVNKFNTFAEPGPITNTDFLCVHGGVPPLKAEITNELCTSLPQAVWEYLHDTFGGGPPCTHLYICPVCQAEMDRLNLKRKTELDDFLIMNTEFRRMENPSIIYGLSVSWFKKWENFVCRDGEPPGPIDNLPICSVKNNSFVLKPSADFCSISGEMYEYLHNIYGGGPAVVLHPNPSSSASSATESSAINLSNTPVPSSSPATMQHVPVHVGHANVNENASSHVECPSSTSLGTDEHPSDDEIIGPGDVEIDDDSLMDGKIDIQYENV